ALFIFLTGQVRAAGVLKMDDATDRFLRTLTELAVAHCLASAEAAAAAAANSGARQDAAGSGPLSFIATDALVSLVAALVVQLNGGETLLNRYLALLVGLIKRDADEASVKFNARPYLRIWVGLMSELGVVPGSHAAAALAAAANADPSLGAPPAAADPGAQMRYLRACGVALHALQPLSVPGFAFGWLELIAHRSFMPRVLTAQLASGWPLFASLLIALLRFLEPYLRAADLSESIKQLYKGCLRLLLVLLHDFPEFLCEHHFSLCEAIPAPAVQMRNLVLSAFPRNMRLPDPFTPNLK
ncbi:CCR4-NOT transcription complex subunit 1, partial [Tetrabaena socialis]